MNKKLIKATIEILTKFKDIKGFCYPNATVELSDTIRYGLSERGFAFEDSIRAEHKIKNKVHQHTYRMETCDFSDFYTECVFNKEAKISTFTLDTKYEWISFSDKQLRKNKKRCIDQMVALLEKELVKCPKTKL